MIWDFQCGDLEKHDGHRVPTEKEVECDGKALCGEVAHEPHQVTIKTSEWCHGICGCGDTFRSPTHGAGDHK